MSVELVFYTSCILVILWTLGNLSFINMDLGFRFNTWLDNKIKELERKIAENESKKDK